MMQDTTQDGLVPDIDAARAAVVALGSEPFFPTTNERVTFHPDVPPFKYRVFVVHDPVGVTLEFVETPSVPKVPLTVAHNTTDPDEYLSFYLDVLGLDFLQGAQTAGPVANVFSPLGGQTQLDGAFFGMPGDSRVFFDWLAWRESWEYPAPYLEPNHLKIVRCAFEVEIFQVAR